MRKLGEFVTSDGVTLRYYEYPINIPENILLHVHGITGSIPNELDEFAEKLGKEGIKVYRLVLRGYPPSDGKTGDIDSFDKFISDIIEFYNYLRKKHVNLPVFVMGHSLGGTLVIHAAYRDLKDVNGVILHAPGYKTGQRFKLPIKKVLKVVLGGIFTPSKVMVDTLTPPERIPHPKDREELERKIGDPHYVHTYSPRFLLQARKYTKMVGELVEKCNQPMLMIYGDEDGVVEPSGSQEIFERWGGGDKDIYVVKGGGHGVHVAYESINKIINWIKSHSNSNQIGL